MGVQAWISGSPAGGRDTEEALPGNQLSSGRAPINTPSSGVPSSVQENKRRHNNKKLTNSNNNKKKRCVDHLASDQCVACPCRRPTSSASSSSSSPSSGPSSSTVSSTPSLASSVPFSCSSERE